jgi:hypothetical protein
VWQIAPDAHILLVDDNMDRSPRNLLRAVLGIRNWREAVHIGRETAYGRQPVGIDARSVDAPAATMPDSIMQRISERWHDYGLPGQPPAG